jgi:hypothetical protein
VSAHWPIIFAKKREPGMERGRGNGGGREGERGTKKIRKEVY